MPRIEFDTYYESKQWLNTYIKPSDKGYIGYHTKDNELVLLPSRSTQPILIGYIRKCTEKEAREFSSSAGVIVYPISRFEFNSERSLPVSEVIA